MLRYYEIGDFFLKCHTSQGNTFKRNVNNTKLTYSQQTHANKQ